MHQPTLRVLQILQNVSAGGDAKRLVDLSRELDIPKSTLVPILQTLCANQYLTQDNLGRYSPGTALFSLGAVFAGKFPILRFVHQQLEALVQELGETCYFGVLDGSEVLYLEKEDSPQPLRMLTTVGRRLPAYATGIGKALLMEKGEEALNALYPAPFEKLTEHTVGDLNSLMYQLRQARIDGYAWEVEESTPHVRCFAVPVRKFGVIVAAISVTIPIFRYQEEERARIIRCLKTVGSIMEKTFEQTDAHFTDIF